ncbi:MAG: pyridoxamine 5'-phosphate oxidase family protein [Methanobacteriota archaeon]|nr:MAG: pyridoxamine 5'-phosphate oxidase family protein [Euryarchaeota archaeon]
MDMKEYFERTGGVGVLSTADSSGKVNSAVFAKPHVMEDGSVAFIMPGRLTHRNLQENPHAAYLFMEEGGGYRGVRLHLTKLREERDSELLYSLRRVKYDGDEGRSRFLVFFRVDRVLPLVGSDGSMAPFKVARKI